MALSALIRRQTQNERPRPVFRFAFGVFPALVIFGILSAYQLSLPGLHYDEAKEAGLNAMQLVTGQPVTAFRDATAQLGPWRLPLMVQDYIGGLNVLLAAPFLALGGVNVIALRWLPLVIAGLTLLLTARIAWRLGGPIAAGVTALLLAVNPSFIFWSRQGIFVTNLTALIFMASLLTGLRWWTERKPRDLWLTAFLWGLGIYAKLLFVWAVGAMVGAATLAWVVEARNWKLETGSWKLEARNWKLEARNGGRAGAASSQQPATGNQHPAPSTQLPATSTQLPATSFQLRLLTWGGAAIAFLLPLIPLVVFNLRTAGTLTALFGNLGRSYYGVDNTAYLPNLLTRLGQLVTLLRGDHFWYLGGVFANAWAPWLAGGLAAIALAVRGCGRMGVWENGGVGEAVAPGAGGQGGRGAEIAPTLPHSHTPTLPLALIALIVAQSAFTVSDLFITHYVLLLPLIPLAGGLAAATFWAEGQGGRGAEEQGSKGAEEQGGSDVSPLPPHAHTPTRPHAHTPTLLRAVALVAVLTWAGGDLWTTVRYHRSLTASGGHAGHSDAIGDLAGYLARGGLSAPVTLDWGIDAPVRFLTAGQINPIEVFGYAPLDAPDPGFAARVSGFLENPANVYLAHAAEATVFRGRVETLAKLAAGRGLVLREEIRFDERTGRPLFVIYRVGKP
jgi:hypothetical protein